MYRHLSPVFMILLFLTLGCNSGNGSPTLPDDSSSQDFLAPGIGQGAEFNGSGQVLWGIWGVCIDKLTGEIELVRQRSATFTGNVTHFLSPPFSPMELISFQILPGSDLPSGYINIGVAITHPFPGLNQFRGFDVRTIFMADGTKVSDHDPAIIYPDSENNEAYMLNADGYTRWWNSTEFTDPLPLLSYKPANTGTQQYPTSTLNPYKYFADDLTETDDVAVLPPENRGVFSPGGSNLTRNFQIQFPVIGGSPSFKFNLAVAASWQGPDPSGAPDYPIDSFPPGAQCSEAYHVRLDTSGSDIWYDNGESGGSVLLELEVFDWQSLTNPDGVTGEVVAIYVESPLLGAPNDILPLATVLPGTQTTSAIFQVEIPSADLQFTSSGEFSIFGSVESTDPNTYQPQLGGGENFLFPEGPLAAYFMGTVEISPDNPSVLTLIQPNGGEVLIIGSSSDIEWTGGFSISSIKIEYSKDDFVSDIIEIAAGVTNNGSYSWDPIPDDQSDTVKIRVSDAADPATYDDSDEYFEITSQCTFDNAPGYVEKVDLTAYMGTGYEFLNADSGRVIAGLAEADGDDAFPWLAVYDESDFTSSLDTFEVPGWSHPNRPWCFKADSTDRIFFFMANGVYQSPDTGPEFDTIYHIDWDGSDLVDLSFDSIDISSLLDSGESGVRIYVDSDDDVYCLTDQGKVLKFDHLSSYSGSELFDLDGSPDYPSALELGFLKADSIDCFFIYTDFGSGKRAIYKVASDGTVLASDTDIFAGIVDCASSTGGIGTDGDCRLVVIDGHTMYGWACLRYDYALDQKASTVELGTDIGNHPGNTVHFSSDEIWFNAHFWQWNTEMMKYDLPSDW